MADLYPSRNAESLDSFPWPYNSNKNHNFNSLKRNTEQYCPVHAAPKCTCNSIEEQENENDDDDNKDNDNIENENSPGKPFTNNPSYPTTQRDIVGNNLQFNPTSTDGWSDGETGNLQSLLMYRDALKRNLTTPMLAGGGLPKMRCGRIGSSWRHIKQTNTYSGSNLLFIDGTVRVEDSYKFPMNRFGYPPKMKHHQSLNYLNKYDTHRYGPTMAQSFNTGTAKSMDNFHTRSMDNLAWSGTNELNRRPSISQYDSRYSHHPKDAYWPKDGFNKKPKGQQCCA